MKKVIYALLCCAALLTVGTAAGREALTQMAAGAMQRAPEDGDTYVYVNSVVDLEISYDVESDRVKINFTAPRQAEWRPETWDDYEFETVDKICIYRNEGQFYDEDSRVLVKEFTDVPKGQETAWEDDSPLEHGKTFYYNVIGVMGDKEGGRDGKSILVGQTIDAASSFNLIPGANGMAQVTVQLVAPTTTNGGDYQVKGNIPKIEITRQNPNDVYGDGTVIKTFEDVAPGAELEYVDADEALQSGKSYRYRLNIYYDGSKVRPWQNNAEVFIGADDPDAVESVTADVLGDGASVKVSWTPCEGPGVKGGWVDPATLCYNVYRSNTSDYNDCPLIAEGIKTTEFTDRGIATEGTYMYIVYTCNGSTESRATYSNRVTAGPLTTMPFIESWSNYKPKYPTWEKTQAWAHCSSMTCRAYTPTYTEVKFEPFDSDNGMMACQPTTSLSPEGTVESLTTGRISMEGAVNPILSFEYLDIDPVLSDNVFNVYVAKDGDNFVKLNGIDIEALPGVNQWINFTIPLKDYIGTASFIQVKFEVVVGSMVGKSAIDKVQVRELMPVDLAVNSVTAAKKFYPGAKFKVNINVSNTGDSASGPFSAKLYIGESELGEIDCAGLHAFQSTTLAAPVAIPEDVQAGEQELKVELTAAGEANTGNNVGSASVEVVELPFVAEFSHNDGELTWDAVAALPFNDGEAVVVEDFNNYAHLTTDGAGEWTMLDADGSYTYWFNASNFPLDGDPIGCVVVNPSAIGAHFTPAAGEQCLLFVSATGNSDDWLISPELPGMAQELSFKVLTTDFDSESFEVMYSTTDNRPESFISAKKFNNFSSENKWTQIEVSLPEGTKYFAIHYCSFYCSGLAVDDLHYMSGTGLDTPPTAHIGYNVWCDGLKVNDDVITDTRYTLPDGAPQGEYTVKAVYNNAESKPSAALLIRTDGIANPAAGSTAGVTVDGNCVTIAGDGAYSIFDMNGRKLAEGTGSARVTLAHGTYVVVAGNNAMKVAIK